MHLFFYMLSLITKLPAAYTVNEQYIKVRKRNKILHCMKYRYILMIQRISYKTLTVWA